MLVKNYQFHFSDGTIQSFVEEIENQNEEITIEYNNFYLCNGYADAINQKTIIKNNPTAT